MYYIYCVYADALRGLKKLLDSLELESQVVVSPATWALGTEPGSSAKSSECC